MSLVSEPQQHRDVPLSPPGDAERRQSEVRWVQGVECRVISGAGFGGGSVRAKLTPPEIGKMCRLQKGRGHVRELAAGGQAPCCVGVWMSATGLVRLCRSNEELDGVGFFTMV